MKSLTVYELDDLLMVVRERIESGALDAAFSVANRMGELEELLRLLGMGDLADSDGLPSRPMKVVVLGDSEVREDKLKSIVKRNGLSSRDFEFALGYEELKHFNFAKLRDSLSYLAVMVGPMPHSTPGKRDASSAIQEMKDHPDLYPPVIELRDSNGLKITNNSFGRGLSELKQIQEMSR